MSAPRLVKAFQDAQLHVFPQATFLPYLHHVAAPVPVFEQAAYLADGVMRAVSGPAADPGLPIPTAAHREERPAGTGAYLFFQRSTRKVIFDLLVKYDYIVLHSSCQALWEPVAMAPWLPVPSENSSSAASYGAQTPLQK